MKISAHTKLFALLGDPVSHSLSPALHNTWIEALGLDAVYAALRIAEDGADLAFESLSAYGLKGANVTVPHKERAAKAAAGRLDPAAAALNAVNVLVWDKGGLAGYNTDAPGLVAALDESGAGWRSKTGTALVIGAGGASRAAALGLSQAGVQRILVANRTFERAQKMCETIPRTQAFAWEKMGDLFESADLIIQGTSAGMKGQASPDWPIARAPSHAIVMDAVYAPLETPLLAAARARGLIALDGLGMLLHQAALAFEIWHGVAPDLALGRMAMLEGLSAREAEQKT
ncbi:MAG: shikimate dehydrogenase [Hyphomonadaceae bacterium]